MEIKPIRDEIDYEEALREIDALFDAEPGTSEADKLEVLVTLVEVYESKRHSLPPPDPIEAIEHALDRLGLTQHDIRPYIGSRSRVWEIMNRRRPLTLPMIRKLAVALGVPADVLAREYKLEPAREQGQVYLYRAPTLNATSLDRVERSFIHSQSKFTLTLAYRMSGEGSSDANRFCPSLESSPARVTAPASLMVSIRRETENDTPDWTLDPTSTFFWAASAPQSGTATWTGRIH